MEAPETLKKLQAQLFQIVGTAAETEGLRQDNANLRIQLEKKDGDANGHLRELWSVRAQMQSQAKELTAERETANSLREKLGMLRDEHSPLKQRVEDLENALEQANSELQRRQTDHDTEMSALEQELAKERDLVAEKIQEIEAKAKELKEFHALTDDLKHQVDNLKVQATQAEELEQIRQLSAQQVVDLKTMEDRLEEQQRAMSEREIEFGESMHQLEETCKNTQQRLLSESKLHEEEVERVQRISEVQVRELQDSIAILEQQGEQALEREAQLTEKLRLLEESCKIEKSRASQERLKEQKQSRETLARRETDLQNAKARLAEQSMKAADREVEFKQLTERLDEANKSKAKLQAKLKELAQATDKKHDLALVDCVREKERRIVELQAEIEHAKVSLNNKDEVIREQARELSELEVQHQEQAERLRTCELTLEQVEQQRVEPTRTMQCYYQDDIDVRMQNRDLLLTTKQLHQECEMLETENRSLKETNEYFIDELDQHATNIGHTNHKQKIRYTLKLKEELNRLFMELRKSRQRVLQLEASQINCGLPGSRTYEQRPSPQRSGREGQSVRRHSTGTFSSPRRASPNGKGSPRPSPCASPGRHEVSAHHRAEETEHACHLQIVALEKLSVDHQHLKTLVERVVLRNEYANESGNIASTSELLDKLRGNFEHTCDVGAEIHEPTRALVANLHEKVRHTPVRSNRHIGGA